MGEMKSGRKISELHSVKEKLGRNKSADDE